MCDEEVDFLDGGSLSECYEERVTETQEYLDGLAGGFPTNNIPIGTSWSEEKLKLAWCVCSLGLCFTVGFELFEYLVPLVTVLLALIGLLALLSKGLLVVMTWLPLKDESDCINLSNSGASPTPL